MRVIILLACLAAIAFAAYRVTSRYRASTGTTWQRVLATAEGSATVLWGYIVALGGLAVQAASSGADVLNMPEIKEWITSYLSPELAGGVLLVIGVLTVLARFRSLFASSDAPVEDTSDA